MPVFFERFVLPVMATLLIGVALMNPLQLAQNERLAIGAAALICAFFAARYISAAGKKSNLPVQVIPTAIPVELSVTATVVQQITEQPAQIHAASTTLSTDIDREKYISLDLQHLENIFEHHTAIQTNKLLDVYKGKLTRIGGTVFDVSGGGKDNVRVTLETLDGSSRDKRPWYHVSLTICPEQSHTAEVLRKKQHVTVDGEISEIDDTTLRLKNCKFIDAI